MRFFISLIALTASLAFGSAMAAEPVYHEFIEGNPKAKVTVIEYASFTCPHCAAFYNDHFATLKKDYIDTGKIKFIFRDLPTPPQELAMAAAQLTRCAPGNKGPAMIAMLYKNQREWMQTPEASLRQYSKLSGMSDADFDACLKNETMFKAIAAVIDHAATVEKVESTPTFLIGDTKLDTGDYPALTAAIDKALGK